MKSIRFWLCLLGVLTASGTTAQHKVYDPLLDPAVEVSESPVRTGDGEYLWYPGQLSAHLQQRRMRESAERCVNVGYPGNFYAPLFRTSFRKTLHLDAETHLEWQATGEVRVSVNGREAIAPVTLPRGRHTVLFEVMAEDNIPSIKVLLNGEISTDGWQASLDKIFWNAAESSPVYGTAGRTPLDDPEVAAVIRPRSILPLRNAAVDGDRITIGKNGYALIDFFHIELGRVSFRAKGSGKLTVFVGESPEEAMNENTKTFEQFALEPHELTGGEQEIVLPERALRYVKIVADSTCEISNVRFTAKLWPVEFRMRFECDDERINDLWNASVATLHTSTHGFYLDGIKRDYLPWSMDAVLSTFGGDYVFGDRQTSLNSLSVALMPLNPTRDDIGIPDYPLHALIGFKQHLLRYGDFNTILAYRDRMEQLLRFYDTLQDDRGFIGGMGVWGFVPGWADTQGPDRKGVPAYAQIMLLYNYAIGAEFAAQWGDRKFAAWCRDKAGALKTAIMTHFWDEQRGLFINGYTAAGERDTTVSHHAQYWAILAGLYPEARYDDLFAMLRTLPDYRENVSYEKGYEMLAYARAGRVAELWDFLLDVFGDWLEQGHTRFPENFRYRETKERQLVFYERPYGLSLCHGANGVPAIVGVLNGIAGFSPSDTQPNHYTIRPDLIHLGWANVEFPVAEGTIKLRLSRTGQNTIELPAGCTVDYIDPAGRKTMLTGAGNHTLAPTGDPIASVSTSPSCFERAK